MARRCTAPRYRQPPATEPSTRTATVSIGQISSEDVIALVREVFSTGGSRNRDQAIREIAQGLGYSRVGKLIYTTLDDAIRTAVRRGILENTSEGLQLLCRNITDYDRDFLVGQLLAGMGGKWWSRPDLIHATARWLGFRRRGATIRKTLANAIRLALRRGLLERNGPDRVRRSR